MGITPIPFTSVAYGTTTIYFHFKEAQPTSPFSENDVVTIVRAQPTGLNGDYLAGTTNTNKQVEIVNSFKPASNTTVSSYTADGSTLTLTTVGVTTGMRIGDKIIIDEVLPVYVAPQPPAVPSPPTRVPNLSGLYTVTSVATNTIQVDNINMVVTPATTPTHTVHVNIVNTNGVCKPYVKPAMMFTTDATCDGTYATLTFLEQYVAPYSAGDHFLVAGVAPALFNKKAVCHTCTTSQITYACSKVSTHTSNPYSSSGRITPGAPLDTYTITNVRSNNTYSYVDWMFESAKDIDNFKVGDLMQAAVNVTLGGTVYDYSGAYRVAGVHQNHVLGVLYSGADYWLTTNNLFGNDGIVVQAASGYVSKLTSPPSAWSYTADSSTSNTHTVSGSDYALNGGVHSTTTNTGVHTLHAAVIGNSVVQNVNNVTSSPTPIALTFTDYATQVITGTVGQVIKLPDATTLIVGAKYPFINNATGVLNVQDSTGAYVKALATTQICEIMLDSTATAAGTWSVVYDSFAKVFYNQYGTTDRAVTATTGGTAGQVLTSGTGEGAATSWTTPTTGTVTSVGVTVPSFLTVTSGSPVTSSGTIVIGYNSGTGLPLVNGGTGLTSLGTAHQVLTVNSGATAADWEGIPWNAPPAIGGTTPNSGVFTQFRADNLVQSTNSITSAGTTTVLTFYSQSNIVVTGTVNQTIQLPDATTLQIGWTYPIISQTTGTISVNDNSGTTIQTVAANKIKTFMLSSNTFAVGVWVVIYDSTLPGSGTVTSVNATVPSFLSVTGGPITSNGTLTIGYSSTVALPIANGGTGNTTGTATINHDMTGPITGTGNVTSITSQTGTGTKFVMDTSPTLVSPALGTPTALVGTNITGTASGLTAGNVTTNAALTGPITTNGTTNATSITSQTGTGTKFVMDTSPTLVTPLLGTPTSGVLTNCTGIAAGLTAGHVTTNANLTGVITSSGNATLFGAQYGTGSNIVTAPTGGTAGQFLTSGAGASAALTWSTGGATAWTTPGTIGSTTPNTGAFTTLSTSNTITSLVGAAGGGSQDYLRFGTAVSTYNCGQVQFVSSSAGSSSNYMSLCMFGGVKGINVNGLGQVAFPQLSDGILQTVGNILTSSTFASLLKAPTMVSKGAGSTTYSPPTSPYPLYLRVEMIGAGGGGGGGGAGSGSGGTSGSAGGNGGNTSFNNGFGIVNTCNGGSGGYGGPLSTTVAGGAGGTLTVNFSASKQMFGTKGGDSQQVGAVPTFDTMGGEGGGCYYGAGGSTARTGQGSNSFGGGGGGGGVQKGTTGPLQTGGGGGGGGYMEFIYANPALTSFTITVGSGGSSGAGGTGGWAGAAGNDGAMYIYEHYQ